MVFHTSIHRHRLLAVPLALLLLAACTTDAPEPTPTTTPTASPEATRTPFPPAVIITPTPTPDRDTRDTRLKVTIVDLDTFETIDLLDPYQPVYESDRTIFAPDFFFPVFTSDGTGVWLSFRDESLLRRINLDGSIAREISDAWRLEELADGRVYYYGLDDGRVELRLFDETGRPLGEFHSAFGILSPDGDFIADTAGSASSDGRTAPLTLTDLRTGQTTPLDETVGLCECDSRPRIYWSPSGRYFAYEGTGAMPPPHDSPQEDAGVFLVDTHTSEVSRLTPYPWGFTVTWFGEDEILIPRDGGLVILHVPTGTERTSIRVERPISNAVVLADRQLLGITIGVFPEPPEARIVELASGRELGHWDGHLSGFARTPDGLVAILRDFNSPDGCRTMLVHPTLDQPICLPESGEPVLDSTGRYLAIGDHEGVNIYDLEAGLKPIYTHPTTGLYPWIEWYPQGTHLLIAQGFGL